MSIFKRQVNSSSDFSSFFSFITFNSSVSLQPMHFLLCTKGSHENTDFDTFKCSDENLPNSLCHFPNHKSVFLQTSHDSSVSSNITPLYFFRLNVVYFQSANFLHFLVLGSKFTQFLPFFKQKISFSSNFAPLFGIMRHISSILFLYTFSKCSLSKYKSGETSPEQSKV